MPGKAVAIGPFTGGLNNISVAGEAEDTEVVDLINFDVSRDTSLTSRPPLNSISETQINGAYEEGWYVLGIYREDKDTWYAIVRKATDSVGNTRVEAYAQGNFATTGIVVRSATSQPGDKVVSMIQFQDNIYCNVGAGATSRGFSWNPKDSDTTINSMPRGDVLISWKSRLWVSGTGRSTDGDRVWFSAIDSGGLHPDQWNNQDFFDTAPGEGGFITAMISSFNNLVIFKSDGTWRFTYPSDPADGQIDKISGQVGAANADSVIDFENFIYVYDQGRVYEMVNGNFSQINLDVHFEEDSKSVDALAPGVSISIVNRRLIVRYFNAVYVFTVDTKTWSQWRSYAGTPGKFVELPTDSTKASSPTYLAGSSGTLVRTSPNYVKGFDIWVNDMPNGILLDYNRGSVDISINNSTASPTGKFKLYLIDPSRALIPASAGLKYDFSSTLTSTSGTYTLKVEYTKLDSSKSTESDSISSGSASITSPSNSIFLVPYIEIDSLGAGDTTTINNISFARKSDPSPSVILRFIDGYQDLPTEYIECTMQTKSYNYNAPSVYKRLFWWGIDLRSMNKIEAVAYPIGKPTPITWKSLEDYTHQELQKGTWGNPLDWLIKSVAVLDTTDLGTGVTENDRFFVKALKALRFRQIYYKVTLYTTGDLDSGPVNVYSLTTYVLPKEQAVEKAS